MDDVLTQQPITETPVSTTTTSTTSTPDPVDTTTTTASPTAGDLNAYYDAIRAIVASKSGVGGIDFVNNVSGDVAQAIATVIANTPGMDATVSEQLRVYAEKNLLDESNAILSQTPAPIVGAETTSQIAAGAYINFSNAGLPGDVATTVASAVAGENAPAVVTTDLLLNAEIENEDTRAVVAPALSATAEEMWNAVNKASSPEQGFNSARGILIAGLGNAIAQTDSGTQAHAELMRMHEKVLKNDLDGFLRDISQSPWSDTGLGAATEKSFERMADLLNDKDPETASKYRSAGKFAGERHAPGSENSLVTMGKNIINLGPVYGTTAVIAGALGDGDALNRIAEGTVKPGQYNALSSPMFLQQLIKQNPNMQLFAPDSRWANAFNKHYFGAIGESSVLASGRGINWQPIGGFVAYHNDSALKKAMMVGDMLNPLTFTANFLSGKLPQQMIWVGSGFGKNINRPDKQSRLAKIGMGLMGNKGYQGVAKSFLSVRSIALLPVHMSQDAFSVITRFLNDRFTAPKGEKSATQKAANSLATGIVFAVVTGGTVGAFSLAYTAANWLTNGKVDKVVWGTIKTTIGVVVVVAMIVTLIATNFMGYITVGKLETYQLHGLSSAGMLPYIKDYKPILTQRKGDISITPGPGANCIGGKIVPVPSNKRIEPKFSPRVVTTHEYKGTTGIDVSHWESPITWSNVRKNSPKIEFTIMKATEGTSYPQEFRSEFSKWWKEAKPIKRSAYHFFRPDEDGYSQANYFLNTIYDAGAGDFGDFQVAVDVEMTDYLNLDCGLQLSTDNLKAFLDQVEHMLGYKAMIYTSNTQWQALTTEPSWSGDYPLWVAAWNNSDKPGTLPKGWSDWLVWQYADDGQVNGIPSAVDMNRWRK